MDPSTVDAVSQAQAAAPTTTTFDAATLLRLLEQGGLTVYPLAIASIVALAIVIGYYVIGHVHHALHTPLMSVTNAISGIIIVGALLEIGQGNAWVTALSGAA